MKALSLRQPWAFAVLYLGKRIENRIWRGLKNGFNTNDYCMGIERGETVGLHASKTKPEDYDWDGVEHAIGRRLTEDEQDIIDAQRGHVIGTMRITDILRTDDAMTIVEGSDAKFPHYLLRPDDLKRYADPDRDLGDWSWKLEQMERWWLGPYAFVLEDVYGLTVPQAATGALGFWEMPDDLLRQVQRHLASDKPILPPST